MYYKLNFFLNCCFTTMWSWERLFGFENKIIVESFPISCKSATLSRLGLPPALASCTVSSLKSPNLLNVRRELQQKTFFLTSFIFSGECFKDLVATSFKKVSFQYSPGTWLVSRMTGVGWNHICWCKIFMQKHKQFT